MKLVVTGKSYSFLVAMALPPTGFTSLLYSASTPLEMYEALRGNKCLPSEGLQQREAVMALIVDTIAVRAEQEMSGPIICGPSAVDQVAGTLLHSAYINTRGHKLSQAPAGKIVEKRAWWQFRHR